ncbi:hypothetical protein CVT25_002996 [Psilocybe cyanescens]|uniref:Myb/SANT-like domain-containing protein n=1 Tax=Psilocybe cyanescens TaxID=93625 RepID=A0A409WN48_PSICY|nr:hypothetical protein CVT25_002996 [Psilocybe cyanescens]
MSPPATWTPAEETELIDFLVDCKTEAGNGGNFKKTTFQQAVTHIAPLLQHGPAKTVKGCQNKWAGFHKIYWVIRAIQAVSGWVWDNDTGASITLDSASSWDDYVKKHPGAKPFHNKGWCHLLKVALLMPSTATGANVYHPTAAVEDPPSPAATSEHSSVPHSDEQPEFLDHEDSDDDQPQSQASAPCKCACEPTTPTCIATKHPCVSHGATVLQDMSALLTQVGIALAAALAPPLNPIDPTPHRRSNAVAAALRVEKTWLSNNELVSFIDFLWVDQTAADIYLALDEPNVRKEWVRIQLERLGVIVF